MRIRMNMLIIFIVTACFVLPSSAAEPPDPNRYLNAVRTFADNVLKYGRDTYGPKHTPLFVDGLNVHTHEPVKWISAKGEKWILSNLASQQNLFRTLDGLSKIAGDTKYRQAAVDAIEYAIANLRSPNGLLHWGGHVAYDAQADEMCMCREKGYNHELKWHFPYYELMWEVNSKETKRFIEAFWSAHILDWSNLDMNRHGPMKMQLAHPWKYEYEGGPVFFETRAASFINTGSDLFYAGSMLHKLSLEKEPLVWSKRLAYRYVETRNPKTGISGYQYSGTARRDSAQAQFGHDFKGHLVLQGTLFSGRDNIVRSQACQLLLGEMLGKNGKEFTQWAMEELTARGKAAYRKKDNSFIPMLTDGTSLEGYTFTKDGDYGPKGTGFRPIRGNSFHLWAYALAYRLTGDEFMWEMARSIAQGNRFGDIRATSKDKPRLRTRTNRSDPYALLGFLELYRKTEKKVFLMMASKIGDNILANQFHKGFFSQGKKHVYARFDNIEPLALLHLDTAVKTRSSSPPTVWPSRSFFACTYRHKGLCTDKSLIYTLTESAEPPWTLEEAAAGGRIDKVKLLISKQPNSIDKAKMETALCRACENGHKEVAELLIARGVDVNAKPAGGDTPLHYVVRSGKGGNDIIELLIAKGADVNVKNNAGQTPVDVAAKRRRKELVKLLIERGGAVSTIHVAAFVGDLGKVKSLMEAGTDADAKDQDGSTPLVMAVLGGHVDVVKFLVEEGADVQATNEQGYTPLLYALWYYKTDIARLLIEKGADVHGKDQWGWTPLHWVVRMNNMDLTELVLSKGADVHGKDQSGYTPLHWAVRLGNRELTELVLSKGADVNVQGKAGETPLEFAIYYRAVGQLLVEKGAEASSLQSAAFMGDLAKVKTFLDAGAGVNAKNVASVTALHAAASAGHKEVVEFLIGKGADISVSLRNGQTPLHWSASGGSREIVELLISRGADIDAKDKNKVTPLHTAAEQGNTDVAMLLVAKGADVNAKDKWVWTPLHYACWKNHNETADFLLAKGADVNAKALQVATPLHVAANRGHSDLVELLIAKGADVNAKNNDGKTALSLAREQEHEEIVGLLRNHGAEE